jgi:hypothetical protein
VALFFISHEKRKNRKENKMEEEILTPVDEGQVSDEGSQIDEGEKVVEPAEPQKQSAEENARYAAIRREVESKAEQRIKETTERAKQEARDAWIAEQGYEWKGKPIKTEAEYKQALKEHELEEKIRKQYSNVPDELLNEIVEGKRFREEALKEKETAKQKETESKMYSDFLEAYPDVKPEDIPTEVWKEVKSGRNLLDAYVRHENKQLKEQLTKFQTQTQIQQANEKNAEISTGAVKNTQKQTAKDPFEIGFDSVR